MNNYFSRKGGGIIKQEIKLKIQNADVSFSLKQGLIVSSAIPKPVYAGLH